MMNYWPPRIAILVLTSVSISPALATQANVPAVFVAQSEEFVSPIDTVLLNQAITPPQQAMAVVVEDICPPPLGFITDSDLQVRCSEMVVAILGGNAQDAADALDGLQALAPEEAAVLGSTQVDASGAQMDNIGERIGNVRTGVATGMPVTYRNSGGFHWSSGAAGDVSSPWGFFVSGLYATSDRDESERESGFDADDYGVTVGIDYSFSDAFLLGVAFGYKNSDADIDRNGGSLETDSYSVFLYWSFFSDDTWYVDAMVGYTDNDHDQQRNISYSIAGIGAAAGTTTTVNNSALSDTDSDELSFSLMAGRNFAAGNWTVSPFARFEFADVEVDGYTETMSSSTTAGSGLALQLDDQDFQSVTASLGGTFTTQFETSMGMTYPQLLVEYVHEFKNSNDPVTGRFVNESLGRTFTLLRDSPDRNYFNLGASLTTMFSDSVSGFFRYQALVGYKDLTVHAFEVGIRTTF